MQTKRPHSTPLRVLPSALQARGNYSLNDILWCCVVLCCVVWCHALPSLCPFISNHAMPCNIVLISYPHSTLVTTPIPSSSPVPTPLLPTQSLSLSSSLSRPSIPPSVPTPTLSSFQMHGSLNSHLRWWSE
jgi:hypothetical protein